MKTLLPWIALSLGLTLATGALATETPQPRFIPLSAATKAGVAGQIPRPLPSGRVVTHEGVQALPQAPGFIALDRARAVTVSNFRPMPVARGVTTGRGLQPIEQVIRARESLAARQKPVASSADQAVLELFGEGYDQARPSEFQKALRTPVTHVWPLPKATAQRLSSGYGMRNDPFDGGRDFHEGIDIAAASGTPVMASAAGVVSKVSSQGPSGKRVSIEHADGSESTYIHLSKQNVREGQNVRQGQVIGAVGSTGRSTGPHLDYRLKKRGHYVNPLSALRPTATTRLALR